MALYKITCSHCDLSLRLCDLPRDYELADKVTLSVRTNYAWCTDCNKAVQAEVIPSKHELEVELSNIQNRDEKFMARIQKLWNLVHDAQIDRRVQLEEEEASHRLNWLKERSSSARCLECASTEIQYFSGSRWEFPKTLHHPSCGGTLLLEAVGFARPAVWHKYDSENIKVRRIKRQGLTILPIICYQ